MSESMILPEDLRTEYDSLANQYSELVDKYHGVLARLAPYEQLGTVEEFAYLKKWIGCGCGLCLSHNNMKCPKADELIKDRVEAGLEDAK